MNKPKAGDLIDVRMGRRFYPIIDGTPMETEDRRYLVLRCPDDLPWLIDAIRIHNDGTCDRPELLFWLNLTAVEPTK